MWREKLLWRVEEENMDPLKKKKMRLKNLLNFLLKHIGK